MSRRRTFLLLSAIAIAGASAAAIWMKLWKPLGGGIAGDRLERVRRSPNWSGGTFRNNLPTSMMSNGGMWRSLVLQFSGKQVRNPPDGLPIQRLSREQLGRPQPDALRAIWIGHSTVLVDIDGVRILTDPIWSDRCSPVEWAGPKRSHPAPISLADAGPVDAVVISHDHYDHLDMATVQSLSPTGTTFFVPLGIGAHLERWGVPSSQIRELDWNEQAALRGVTFVAQPARHYSGRALIDRDSTQWASWAVIGPKHRFYFSGDTGFFPGLNDIGASHGPFDLTLIKIGAYGETWPQIHIDPEEAVAAHLAVRGKLMLPVHWGTFNLGFHDWYEPADRLIKAAEGRATVVVPKPGEVVDPTTPVPVETWWR